MSFEGDLLIKFQDPIPDLFELSCEHIRACFINDVFLPSLTNDSNALNINRIINLLKNNTPKVLLTLQDFKRNLKSKTNRHRVLVIPT